MSRLDPPERFPGYCPLCEAATEFVAYDTWYRDYLTCGTCAAGSLPRDRAMMHMLQQFMPNWREAEIHESSAAIGSALSTKLATESKLYFPTQYHPAIYAGAWVDGAQNENLEEQTFSDGSFDVVIALDVLEHVNEPSKVMREVYRTLRPGGLFLFTTPWEKDIATSVRRAEYLPNGNVRHILEPDYHFNPVSEQGSLVVFNFGRDLASSVAQWAPFNTYAAEIIAPHYGIMGTFTDVFVCRK